MQPDTRTDTHIDGVYMPDPSTFPSFTDALLDHNDPRWNVLGALYCSDRHYLTPVDAAEKTGLSSEDTDQALDGLEQAGVLHSPPYLATGTNIRDVDTDAETYTFVRERFGSTEDRLDVLSDLYDEDTDHVYNVLTDADTTYHADLDGVSEAALERAFGEEGVELAQRFVDAGIAERTRKEVDELPYLRSMFAGPFYSIDEAAVYTELYEELVR